MRWLGLLLGARVTQRQCSLSLGDDSQKQPPQLQAGSWKSLHALAIVNCSDNLAEGLPSLVLSKLPELCDCSSFLSLQTLPLPSTTECSLLEISVQLVTPGSSCRTRQIVDKSPRMEEEKALLLGQWLRCLSVLRCVSQVAEPQECFSLLGFMACATFLLSTEWGMKSFPKQHLWNSITRGFSIWGDRPLLKLICSCFNHGVQTAGAGCPHCCGWEGSSWSCRQAPAPTSLLLPSLLIGHPPCFCKIFFRWKVIISIPPSNCKCLALRNPLKTLL